jgi:hypothetical protein
MNPSLCSRQVHLDFHTGPGIPDVGRDFDPKAFAQAFKRAHVNSVTVFAKCHHGHLYYDTNRPERHPGLSRNCHLLEQQIEALHREGIRAPIYISVQCDEYAANTHPEWVARKEDSSQVKWGNAVFKPGWQILDMSTPYQDFLAEQTREVLSHFNPVDGIFFDMCWDQPSTTAPFMEQMRKAGLNPEDEKDRQKHANKLALAYMKRFHGMVQDSAPGASVFFNGRSFAGIDAELPFQSQLEIEALPSGGWGYLFFPKTVRYSRHLGKPYLGMTARFHKSWADFGGYKPYAALEYETSQMMAHGAACSIGDQLHPRGIPDTAAYDLIESVYKRVADREPWLTGATPVADVGLFHVPTGAEGSRISGIDEGATRLLMQLKVQFDVVEPTRDFSAYKLLILPDAIPIDPAFLKKLKTFLKNGGAIFASGTSGLSPDGKQLVLSELGIKPAGMSPFTATYLRVSPDLSRDIPAADHVMYDATVRVTPRSGTTVLAEVIEPYFERTWDHFSSHFQTPPEKPSGFAAATINGNVAYISAPIFGMYGRHGNLPYRALVRNLIDRLLPEPLLRVTAPSSTEATVLRQQSRTIVHLLQYCPERRAGTLDLVEDIVPIHNVALSLKLEKKPRRVYLAPSETPLAFEYKKGRVHVVVPEVAGHGMVVFE